MSNLGSWRTSNWGGVEGLKIQREAEVTLQMHLEQALCEEETEVLKSLHMEV